MQHQKAGFTIVEILIVVIIVGILATIGTLVYITVQQDTRDNQRSAKATLIAEGLEKYYDKHGEYPSPAALTSNITTNTGTAVSLKLAVDQDILLMPKAPNSTTNSIAPALGNNDVIAYVAKSDINNTSCQTNASSGCDEFTLSYKKERDNETVIVKSRRSGREIGFETTPEAPIRPTVVATQSGTNLIATSSVATCEAGLTARYSFQNRAGSDAWGVWSAWQNGNTWTQTGNQDGVTYQFQTKVRCDSATAEGQESPVSAPASIAYTSGLQAPSVPALTVALSGTNVTATSATTSCSSGTPQYRIDRRTNADTWSTGSWGTSRTASTTNPQQGVRYGFTVSVRCTLASNYSPVAAGTEVSYVHPISAPPAPITTMTTSSTGMTWNWNTTTCPAGTTAHYRSQSEADWGYAPDWYGPYTNFTSRSWTAVSQGYEYTMSVQTRCASSYTTGPWSTSGSASYIRPVATPSAPTNFTFTMLDERRGWTYNWTAPTCGSGVRAEWRMNTWMGPPPSSWSGTVGWTGTGTHGWALIPEESWSNRGYWTPQWSTTSGDIMPVGLEVRQRVQYICVNATTGRTSSWGPSTLSPIFYVY